MTQSQNSAANPVRPGAAAETASGNSSCSANSPASFTGAGAFSRARRIAGLVAAYHGMPVETLMGLDRRWDVARARQEAFYLVRALHPEFSTTRIGAAFRRDHTTIMHGLRAVSARMAKSQDYATHIAAMKGHVASVLARPIAIVPALAVEQPVPRQFSYVPTIC